MKRILESKLDSLKTSWLEDFRLPSTSIINDIGEDTFFKAQQFCKDNFDDYYVKIRSLLHPLPTGQRFMDEEWYRDRYINGLTGWIVAYKAIESVSDELLLSVKENELRIMLLHSEYALERSGISVATEDKDKPFACDSFIDSELNIETFKKAFMQRYSITYSGLNSQSLENFLKKRYAQHEKLEHRATTSGDKGHTGNADNGFRKRLIIGLVSVAKTQFRSDAWKDNFECTQYCKFKGTRDCLLVGWKINSKLECKYNNEALKFLTGCYKNNDCKNKVNNSCDRCDYNYSHIDNLKAWQQEICTDGFIPEIAYLLAKIGILQVSKCNIIKKTCIKTDCITTHGQQCRDEFNGIIQQIKIDKSRVHGLNPLYTSIRNNKIEPLCSHEEKADCHTCIKQLSSLKSIPTNNEIMGYIKALDDIIPSYDRIKNPCPSATKSVYEISSEFQRRWIKDWDKGMKLKYAKLYSKSKTKKEKSALIDEVIKQTGGKRNTIIQDIKRTISKLKAI